HTRRNPWKARTLEWATPLPAPAYNFASLPAVSDRGDKLDPDALGPSLAAGEGYLGFAREHRQETLGVNMITGKPDQVIVLPRPDFLPLCTALAPAGFFLAFLFKFYWLAPVAAAGAIALFFMWSRRVGARHDSGPIPIGRGEAVPLAVEVKDNVAWWASLL